MGKELNIPEPNLPMPAHLIKSPDAVGDTVKNAVVKSLANSITNFMHKQSKSDWGTKPTHPTESVITRPTPKPPSPKPSSPPKSSSPKQKVNNLLKPPPLPIPQPKMEPGDIIKKVVTTVSKDGSRNTPKPAKIKPVIDMREIEISTSFDVEEVDYDDYAQG